MRKTEKLNELFDKWEKYGFKGKEFGMFCKDGIIDEDTYDCQEIKVLFVLKDVHNATRDEEVDLRKSLTTEKGEGSTWFPIVRWARGLLDGEPYSKEIDEMYAEKQHKHIKRIAVLNLKKEEGRASVPDDCVYCYSRVHNKQIREEIEICNPDVIIACSDIVYNALQENVFEGKLDTVGKIKYNEKMGKYGRFFDIKSFLGSNKPVYVVEYRHPSQAGVNGNSEEHYNNMLKIREFVLESRK